MDCYNKQKAFLRTVVRTKCFWDIYFLKAWIQKTNGIITKELQLTNASRNAFFNFLNKKLKNYTY